MPSNALLRNQRALGGAAGLLVLGLAMTYHFFPRLLHVDPLQEPRRSMSMGDIAPGRNVLPSGMPTNAELNAGPPLALAPTAVIVAHSKKKADLPEQLSADPPAVQALLARATKALKAGQLAGDKNSAAALFAQAQKAKPDSRRAAQGLFDVRARMVADIDQDIAFGDADGASDQLDALRTIPDASDDVALLSASLKILTRVRPMLAKAAALLAHGKADEPVNGSALDVYRQVQALDPQNAVAEQGIMLVQRAVLDRALAGLAQNNFGAAESALAEAQAIRPDSQQMQDVSKRVADMRAQRAAGVLAQAGSALDSGNLALAQTLIAQVKGIDPSVAGIAEFDNRLVNARLYAGYKPGQIFSDSYVDRPGKSPAMLVIPIGSFQMGAPDDQGGYSENQKPQHAVVIGKGFAMARSSITVGQFREFVRSSGYVPDSSRLGGASVYDERSGAMRDDDDASWQDDYAGNRAAEDLPVVNISWNDAKAYADWLTQRTGKTYRLPSEAEFEYTLRGGSTTRYWWGEGAPTKPVENVTGSGDRSRSGRRWNNAFRGYRDGYWGPAPVMSFAANPFGLYDIDGNVSAWTQDCWHESYLRSPADGGAWLNPGCSVHVVRGGSWASSPDQVSSAYRQGSNGSIRSGRVGFRVVREF